MANTCLHFNFKHYIQSSLDERGREKSMSTQVPPSCSIVYLNTVLNHVHCFCRASIVLLQQYIYSRCLHHRMRPDNQLHSEYIEVGRIYQIHCHLLTFHHQIQNNFLLFISIVDHPYMITTANLPYRTNRDLFTNTHVSSQAYKQKYQQ